jgi:putative MFS transporter
MFFGATAGGWISDRTGRKKALLLATLWYAGFSLFNAMAWGPAGLFVTRFLTGVGISAMTVIGIAYTSEIFPSSVRGAYQGWIMVIGLFGVPATAYVARLCIPLASWGWRLVFVWGSLGVLFPLLYRFLEESPQWYEEQGMIAEADATLDRIEARARSEFGVLPPVEFTAVLPSKRSQYSDLLKSGYLPRTVLLIFTWICLTLGFYGFTSWVPTLLVAHGFSLIHSLTWSSAMSLSTIPGAILAALVSDRIDRRWSITLVALIIALCGCLYGFAARVGAMIALGMLVEMFIHMFMPLMYAYTAESFPSEIRNSGTGIAYGAGRLANIFGPLIVGLLFRVRGYSSVFLYISMTWVLAAIAIGCFGLRSRDMS